MTDIMDGVRVLEVADYVFVPTAGAVLADWGAEVIKVEHHEHGDMMRGLRTYYPNPNGDPVTFNPIMEMANRGKRSIGINLGDPGGVHTLMELAKTCDVFLTSKLEATRRKLGIDVDDVRRHNPDIVYARGTGHGTRGPEAGTGGFDALDFWYRSGIAAGAKALEADVLPGMPGGAFGDLTSGMNLAGGISAALFHRARTGEAVTVDVSLLGSGMWSMGGAIAQSALFGVAAAQAPADFLVNPLVNNYRTSDGHWIALVCLQSFRYFPDLCRVMERPDLCEDPRFSTSENLDANAVELAKLIAAEFSGRSFADWLERLDDFEGQWAPVQDALLVSSDRQARANDYIIPTRASTGEPFIEVQPPVQFGERPASTRPAPLFNDDGDDILTELGLTMEQIIELRVHNSIA